MIHSLEFLREIEKRRKHEERKAKIDEQRKRENIEKLDKLTALPGTEENGTN